MQKTLTTYSMWQMFRNCRKACEYRYLRHIMPLDVRPALLFGSVIHDCLELFHKGFKLDPTITEFINRAYPNRSSDAQQLANWHLATAMMTGYDQQYRDTDRFEVVCLEKKFYGDIVNPATGAKSKSFTIGGKVDGVVKSDGEYFLLEHKTAAKIDNSYLERLWTDFQITIYTHYIEQELDIKISGIIYNVLAKAKLQQSEGESEHEFEVRRQQLIEKSKTGKSSAKRKMPESNEDFQSRLQEKYKDPEMFHREIIYISRTQIDNVLDEIWELSKSLLDARRRNMFYRNTAYCFNFNRACAYFPICRSDENPNVIANHYQIIEPHTELKT